MIFLLLLIISCKLNLNHNNKIITSEFLVYLMNSNDITFFEESLKKIPDIDIKLNSGSTLLHKACENNLKDVVLILLSLGANPLIQDKEGNTPCDLSKDDYIKDLVKQHEILKEIKIAEKNKELDVLEAILKYVNLNYKDKILEKFVVKSINSLKD